MNVVSFDYLSIRSPCSLCASVRTKRKRKEGRKEMGFFNDALSTFLFMVIWRRTYSKGPFAYRERKPAAVTWATLSD